MKKNAKDSYISSWKQLAKSWQLLTPPWHPGKKNLNDYKKILREVTKNIKSPKVLILGATPEIRDLLAKYKNINVTLVDYNMEMILAMNELIKNNNFMNERWLKSNWIDMPLEQGYYDVIFGDYITTQVPTILIHKLLNKIKFLLSRKGRFVTRVCYYNKDEIKKFKEIIDKFSKFKKNRRIITNLASELFKSIVIKKNNCYIFSLPLVKKLRDKYIRNKGNNELFLFLDKLFFPYKKQWFLFDLSDTEKIIKKHFIIVDKLREPVGSSLRQVTFIYNLKPKN